MRYPLLVLCSLLLCSQALAGLTVTSTSNYAEAYVETTHLGSDMDQQSSSDPVTAMATVEGDLGSATAWASAAPFDISCYAVVGLYPTEAEPHSGASVGAAIDVLLGVVSDSPWRLDIGTISGSDQSAGGMTVLTGQVGVWDIGGTELYSYDFLVDGPFVTVEFSPGAFNVVFVGAAYVEAYAEVAGGPEYAEASIDVVGAVTLIPAPCAFALVCLGSGMTVRLVRRQRS